jgi:hypothetical protein
MRIALLKGSHDDAIPTTPLPDTPLLD